MAFSVRNAAVERKARDYAARHGQTLTGTLELALDKLIDDERRTREADYAAHKARIRAIQEEVAKYPDSGLTEDEIMGWDEDGLPT